MNQGNLAAGRHFYQINKRRRHIRVRAGGGHQVGFQPDCMKDLIGGEMLGGFRVV